LGNIAQTSAEAPEDEAGDDDGDDDVGEKNGDDTDDEEKLNMNQKLMAQMAHNLNTLNTTLLNFLSHSAETNNSTNTILQSIAKILKSPSSASKHRNTQALLSGGDQSGSLGGDQSGSLGGDQSGSLGSGDQSGSLGGGDQSGSLGGDQSGSLGSGGQSGSLGGSELSIRSPNEDIPQRQSYKFVDIGYDMFKQKMDEYLQNRIPSAYQILNFHDMRKANGANLGSILNKIDSTLSTLFIDKHLLK
jgi:hypothetical protein